VLILPMRRANFVRCLATWCTIDTLTEGWKEVLHYSATLHKAENVHLPLQLVPGRAGRVPTVAPAFIVERLIATLSAPISMQDSFDICNVNIFSSANDFFVNLKS
jgi:hypothetical protein